MSLFPAPGSTSRMPDLSYDNLRLPARWIRIAVALLAALSFGECGCTVKSTSDCGLDPALKRTLSSWERPNRHIDLIGTISDGDGTRVLVDLRTFDGKPDGIDGTLYSADHGESWHRYSGSCRGYSALAIQYGLRPLFKGILSSRNTELSWRRVGASSISSSTDGGRSWNSVSSKLEDGREIRNLELTAPGFSDEGRFYARVRPTGPDEDYVFCRSDDCGRTFRIVSVEVLEAVESRASAAILIGLMAPRVGFPPSLGLSRDGGRHWTRIAGELLLEPLYKEAATGSADPIIRTWSKQDSDIPIVGDRPIVQIESDPEDPDTFYVVTWKGVYVTRDQGRRFRLLTLATDYAGGVNAFAVDPLDGRYLYAQVTQSKIYRSVDRGCTWTRVDFGDRSPSSR